MRCADCKSWTIARKRRFNDGSEKTYFEAAPGRGHCPVIDVQTTPDFGCNRFEACDKDFDHVEISTFHGEPWQFWRMGECPDCKGRGCGEGENAGRCYRCQGLGKVRHYEDGYIGEERSRRHPKEPEVDRSDPLLDGRVLAPIPKKDEPVGGFL